MDLNAVRKRLLDERAQRQALAQGLRREQTETVEASELSTVDQHQAELGTETFERERDLAALRIVEDELADIEVALRKLGNGSYGICEECGKPIGEERLAAKPWARLCIVDQARAERAVSRR
jgi:RNA polymerase-binding transcription factor DksA